MQVFPSDDEGPSSLAPPSRASDISLDDQDVCRVCRVEGDAMDPLIHPCKCAGSVRYVHPDCLRRWLAHTQKRHCEICGHRYRFTKIYPDFIPSKIPVTVYARQSLIWLLHKANLVVRFCLAIFAWLIILPSINLFTLRSILWLADTLAHTTPLVSQDDSNSPTSTWKSWYTGQEKTLPGFVFRGQLLSVVLAGIILGLILVREWILQHNWTEQMQEEAEEELINPDDWVVRRGIATRVEQGDDFRGKPEPSNSINTDDHGGPAPHLAADIPALEGTGLLRGDEEAGTVPIDVARAELDAVLQRIDEIPLHALDQDLPQALANRDEWPENPEDANWEREDWDGVFEVVGVIGPWHNLFQNVLFATVIMGAALAVLVGLPIIAGKFALSLDMPKLLGASTRSLFRLVRRATDPIVDICFEILQDVVALPLLSSVRALERITLSTLRIEVSPMPSSTATFTGVIQQHREHLMSIARSTAIIDRAFCILAGYGLALGIAGAVAVSRPALLEQFSQHGRFLKLALFMLIEMAVFPIIAGAAIVLSLSPMFNLAFAQRLAVAPFATIFINWLIGTSFMYAFSAFLSYIRSIVRSGTIFFIRDPSDTSFSPVKDILERPTSAQLRKLSISAGIYCFVIFSLFGVSTRIIHLAGVQPVRIEDDLFTSVPFDLIFLYLGLPPLINSVRPRHQGKRLWAAYWRLVTDAFALGPLMYGQSRQAGQLEFIWAPLDPFFQFAFGTYEPTATFARVPASDRVSLMPQADRKRDGVFIPLDEHGCPKTPQAKLALLKQDRRARQKNRSAAEDYQVVWLPSFWRTRIHVFIFLAITAASVALATMTFVPLIVGRAALGSRHDGYNYMLGASTCALASSAGRLVSKRIVRSGYAKRLRKSDASARFKRSFLSVLMFAYNLTMLYLLVPALIGINIHLYVVGPAGGIRVLHFWDAWSMGLIVAGAVPSRVSVISHMRSPFRSDFKTLNVALAKSLAYLILATVTPSLLAIAILALTPGGFASQRATIARYVYPTLLITVSLFISRPWLSIRLRSLRQKVIDAEYVVEERVENYEASNDPVDEWVDVDR